MSLVKLLVFAGVCYLLWKYVVEPFLARRVKSGVWPFLASAAATAGPFVVAAAPHLVAAILQKRAKTAAPGVNSTVTPKPEVASVHTIQIHVSAPPATDAPPADVGPAVGTVGNGLPPGAFGQPPPPPAAGAVNTPAAPPAAAAPVLLGS